MICGIILVNDKNFLPIREKDHIINIKPEEIMITVLLGLLVSIIAYIIYWSIQLLFAVILTPRFGLVCDKVSFFGLTFEKQNGRWHRVKGKFSIFCQYNRKLDVTRVLKQDTDKMCMMLDFILAGIQIVYTVTVFVLYQFIPVREDFPGDMVWKKAAWDFLYVNILFCLVSIGANVYTYIIARRSLSGYCTYLQKRMISGQPLDDSMMRPLNELPYRHYPSSAKYRYYRLYILYLLWVGRYGDLYQPVHESVSFFSDRPLFIQEAGNYYDLIYYYSRIEYDPKTASKFMNKIRNELATDSDANARRVLAYYAYFVEGDRQKARVFTDQAKACVDVFSVPGLERELERRLVNELDEILAKEGV